MLLGVFLVGLFVFLPAGTFSFPNGWLLMAVLFVPMVLAGFVLMVKNPALLKRRLDGKEKQKEQKTVVALSAIMFILGFAVAGFDFRYGWSAVPRGVIVVGVILFLSAYLLYGEVIRENAFLSRTIGVEKDQKVIETGTYRVVRHPMYLATVLLFLAIPLILGSLFAFLVFLAYPFILARRIKFEEAFLEKELMGYKEYKEKVKYRIVPFIW